MRIRTVPIEEPQSPPAEDLRAVYGWANWP